MKTSYPKLAAPVVAFALALCSACFGSDASELVIAIRNNADIENVNRMLADGWTVKFQSLAASGTGGLLGGDHKDVALLTLSPPSAERRAQNAAAKKADFDRRRAEYLAKNPSPKSSRPNK